MSKYIGVNRKGQEHPRTMGLESCIGTLVNLGTVRHVNLLTDYILVHECNECKDRFYDFVDTIDGRIELA